MIRKLDRLARLCPRLLAVLIVCWLPGTALAQTVVFRNECKAPVVVQTHTVVRGVLLRDSPCLLKPMEATPQIALGVNKIVTVYDAKTNRVLFQDLLRATPMDRAFGIIPHPRLAGRCAMSQRRTQEVKPGKPKNAMNNRAMPGP
jgi:hypothetical protein